MPKIQDLSNLIIHKFPEGITALKLQKLLYYCQAWSLVWEGEEIFSDKIFKKEHGVHILDTYGFKLYPDFTSEPDLSEFSEDQLETVEEVLEFYGDKGNWYLTNLIKLEDPWILSAGVINKYLIKDYYENL